MISIGGGVVGDHQKLRAVEDIGGYLCPRVGHEVIKENSYHFIIFVRSKMFFFKYLEVLINRHDIRKKLSTYLMTRRRS